MKDEGFDRLGLLCEDFLQLSKLSNLVLFINVRTIKDWYKFIALINQPYIHVVAIITLLQMFEGKLLESVAMYLIANWDKSYCRN